MHNIKKNHKKIIILKCFQLKLVFLLCMALLSCSSLEKNDSPLKTVKPYPVPLIMSENGQQSPAASGYYGINPIQCVIYTRDISGINIYGNAHSWWPQAHQKNYKRGAKPKKDSVLVLKKTRKLRYGHVAVVKKIVDKRHIDITHSNWGSDRKKRSFIYQTMRVKDISRKNDWSSLVFWNMYTKNYGSPYAAHGFIYQKKT
jgi:surface antigen